MNRSVALQLVLLCLVFVTGCPYSANVPLTEPEAVSAADQLLGHWVGIDSKGDTLRVDIFPFNQREYLAEMRQQAGDVTRLRVFPFDIRGELFLHVNEISPARGAQEYLLARYSFPGKSEMSVRFVGDKIVPEALASDAKRLRAFVESHLSDPELNDKDSALTLRRSD